MNTERKLEKIDLGPPMVIGIILVVVGICLPVIGFLWMAKWLISWAKEQLEYGGWS